MYGDSAAGTSNEVKIKEEAVFEADSPSDENDTFYGSSRGGNSRGRGRGRNNYNNIQFCGRWRGNSRNRGGSTPKQSVDGQNPEYHGEVGRCLKCDSKMHFVKDCPHATPNAATETETRITLFQCDLAVEEMRVFIGEFFSCGLLDSGCPGTVCGKSWLKYYVDSLTNKERNLLEETSSVNRFRFGKGDIESSLMMVKIPAYVAGQDIFLMTDVVESDIPLLLSKNSMKKAKAVLDFDNDEITFLGVKESLIVTRSGHYGYRYVDHVKCLKINQKLQRKKMWY